ncbi:hypothetical protein WJX79_002076 [Trebouxia sp. C0005]
MQERLCRHDSSAISTTSMSKSICLILKQKQLLASSPCKLVVGTQRIACDEDRPGHPGSTVAQSSKRCRPRHESFRFATTTFSLNTQTSTHWRSLLAPSAEVLALPPGNGPHLQSPEIISLKEQLADKDLQFKYLTASLRDVTAEIKELKAQLQEQQQHHAAELKARSQQHQAELSAQRDTMCQQLEGTCKQQEQEFAKTVQDMIRLTEEHAGQYVRDLDFRDRRIDDLKEQLQDSGKHGQKRPRDHSNGRDSKRRS